jgi:thiamine-monophosphate kinase
MAQAVGEAGVVLAGGDLATTDRLTATLTLLGDLEPGSSWPGRDRARPGDALWLGGTLGESAAGRLLLEAGARWDADAEKAELPADLPQDLVGPADRAVRRHLLPTPQLALGARLGGYPRVASLDLSDGLARDLHRILRASGVRAEIEASRLPAAPAAADLADWLGQDLLDLQLFGGEDYVLLFALPEPEAPPEGCHRIGSIVEGEGARVRVGGAWEELEDRGWDHLR